MTVTQAFPDLVLLITTLVIRVQGGNAQGEHIASYLRAHYNFFFIISNYRCSHDLVAGLDTVHSQLKSVIYCHISSYI